MSLLGKILVCCAAALLLALALGCVYFFLYAMKVPRRKKRARKRKETPETPEQKAFSAYWQKTRAWYQSLTGKEEWTARTGDGKTLRATFVPNGESDTCALLIHGWHARHEDMAEHGNMLYSQKHCALLLPQQRAHGRSEGRFTTMGYWESRDMLLWIDQLIARGMKKIIVLGVSMGAGTVMMLSSLDLPKEVICLVEDCGYTSVREEYLHVCGNMLGKFRFLAPVFVSAGSLLCRVFLGCWYRDISCEKSVARANRPMLFIHGESDDFVPFWMYGRNLNACTSEKNGISIPKAKHAQALYVDPAAYNAALAAFYDRYMQ